jgi:hypothetical protein
LAEVRAAVQHPPGAAAVATPVVEEEEAEAVATPVVVEEAEEVDMAAVLSAAMALRTPSR